MYYLAHICKYYLLYKINTHTRTEGKGIILEHTFEGALLTIWIS